jgi:hypothetical protein
VFGPVAEDNTIVDREASDADQDWAELETVIRPMSSEIVDDVPTQAGVDPSAPRRPLAIRQRRAQPEDFQGGDTRRVVNPTLRKSQIVSLAVGVVIVTAALLVGFLLGNRVASLSSDSVRGVTVNQDPRLETHLPEGGTLSVDGRDVTGTSPLVVPLTAGHSHVIRVSKVGYYPLETVIKLNYNDVHVMWIQADTLLPKDQ